MIIKLPLNNWDMIEVVLGEKHKDYSCFESEGFLIVVYGYPFKNNQWITAEGIANMNGQRGEVLKTDVDGVYSIIIIDKRESTCSIITDRYGVYTMFYYIEEKCITISDNIMEIIPCLSDPLLNEERAIEYLHFGFRLGKETLIKNIDEFESARIYEIDRSLKIKETIYWEFQGKSQDDKMSLEELRGIFNDHIMTGLNLEERISLPLTGGIDTRTILSSSLGAREKLHCYTHGIRGKEDVRIAQEICDHFNIEHDTYELEDGWAEKIPSLLSEKSVEFNGLVPSISRLHVLVSLQREEERGEVFMSGAMGNEIWRSCLAKAVANCTSVDEVAGSITNTEMKNKMLGNVYRNYDSMELRELVRGLVMDELSKAVNTTDSIGLAEYFGIRNYCSNRMSSLFKVIGRKFKVFPAMLNKDLIQQIPVMSTKDKVNGVLQKYIISRNNEYLSQILLDSGKSIMESRWANVGNKAKVLSGYLRRSTNLVLRSLCKKDVFRVIYFTDYAAWLRTYHKTFVLDVLSYEQMKSRDLFARKELESIIDLFFGGDDSVSKFIFGVLSLEVFLKAVIDKEAPILSL